MRNSTLANFKRYFPSFANKIEQVRDRGWHEIIVKLLDGRSIAYDDVDRSIRHLPDDSYNMTEQQCRVEFGSRLCKIMRQKGITQSMLSSDTKIPQPSLSKYVTAQATPSFYNADRIAKALGCSLDDLRYF